MESVLQDGVLYGVLEWAMLDCIGQVGPMRRRLGLLVLRLPLQVLLLSLLEIFRYLRVCMASRRVYIWGETQGFPKAWGRHWTWATARVPFTRPGYCPKSYALIVGKRLTSYAKWLLRLSQEYSSICTAYGNSIRRSFEFSDVQHSDHSIRVFS